MPKPVRFRMGPAGEIAPGRWTRFKTWLATIWPWGQRQAMAAAEADVSARQADARRKHAEATLAELQVVEKSAETAVKIAELFNRKTFDGGRAADLDTVQKHLFDALTRLRERGGDIVVTDSPQAPVIEFRADEDG